MKAEARKSGQKRRAKMVVRGGELTAAKVASKDRAAYLLGVGFFLYLWFLGINLIGQVVVALRPTGHPGIARADLITSLSLYAFPMLGCLVFLWIFVQEAKPIQGRPRFSSGAGTPSI